MELIDLVGKHKLFGVDYILNLTTGIYTVISKDGKLCTQCVNIRLDNITYTIVEDPMDGYRSSMEKIIITDNPVINNFDPINVICKHVGVSARQFINDPKYRNYFYNHLQNILEIYDESNNNLILRVGTKADLYWDYYPLFLYEWIPENMSVNIPTIR